jgi:hypothetical protein
MDELTPDILDLIRKMAAPKDEWAVQSMFPAPSGSPDQMGKPTDAAPPPPSPPEPSFWSKFFAPVKIEGPNEEDKAAFKKTLAPLTGAARALGDTARGAKDVAKAIKDVALPPDHSVPHAPIVLPDYKSEEQFPPDPKGTFMGRLGKNVGVLVSSVKDTLLPPMNPGPQVHTSPEEQKGFLRPNTPPDDFKPQYETTGDAGKEFPGKPFPATTADSPNPSQPATKAKGSVLDFVRAQKPDNGDAEYQRKLDAIIKADMFGRAMSAGEKGLGNMQKLMLTTGSAIRTGANPVPNLESGGVGEALSGNAAMRFKGLEDQENREVKKSQISANDEYKNAMLDQRLEGRRSQQLEKAKTEFQGIVKVRQNALQNAMQARAAIVSGTQTGAMALKTLLQKAAGDSGNISQSEQAQYGQRVQIIDRIKDYVDLVGAGKISEGRKEDILKLIKTYEEQNDKFLDEMADNYASSYSYITGIPPQELKHHLLRPEWRENPQAGAPAQGGRIRFSLDGRSGSMPEAQWDAFKQENPGAQRL